jgi:hypothetical protein
MVWMQGFEESGSVEVRGERFVRREARARDREQALSLAGTWHGASGKLDAAAPGPKAR